MNDQSLGVGLYSVVEAARLLKTPRRTLARWVEGYVLELRDGMKAYAPVIARKDQHSFLTFGELVELMYVGGFRKEGVKLEHLRAITEKFRDQWQTPYPLATKRFATDGRALLVKLGNEWEHALTGQGQAFFDEIGRQLVHTGDLTSEWRPLGEHRSVVLNPNRQFGKPIENKSGAHTYILAEAFGNEGEAAKVAWWYDTSVEAVLDAVEFEKLIAKG